MQQTTAQSAPQSASFTHSSTEAPIPPVTPVTPDTQVPPAAEAASSSSNSSPAPSIGDLLQGLRSELMTAVHDRVHLVMLEVKQAGIRATEMVLLATLAALLTCTAWLTLMVAVYMACVSHGMPWGVALLVVFVLNIAVAIGLWFKALSLSEAFTFPATRRMIRGTPANSLGAQPKS